MFARLDEAYITPRHPCVMTFTEQKAQAYQACLEQSKNSESMKDLRYAEKILDSLG